MILTRSETSTLTHILYLFCHFYVGTTNMTSLPLTVVFSLVIYYFTIQHLFTMFPFISSQYPTNPFTDKIHPTNQILDKLLCRDLSLHLLHFFTSHPSPIIRLGDVTC